jgi:hypothetical protein
MVRCFTVTVEGFKLSSMQTRRFVTTSSLVFDPREPGENLIGRYVFYQDVYLLRKQQLTDSDICLLLNMRVKYT